MGEAWAARHNHRQARNVQEIVSYTNESMQVFFDSKRELAPSIWEYSFRTERAVHFVPGQYVSLQLYEVTDDGRGSSRTFTIVSLPAEGNISFVVKHPENHSAYKEKLSQLRQGEPAAITDSMGDVILPKLNQLPLVFVAGGIGIASYVSILRSLLAEQDKSRTIHLLYGRRERHDIIYADLLKQFPFASKQLCISPQRITIKDILRLTDADTQIYLSGAQHFVEDLSTQLRIAGIGNERIVFDFFDGYREEEV